MRLATTVALLSLGLITALADDGLPPGVKNSQNPRDIPPSPEEAVRLFAGPRGFNITLFAGEPDVSQPIALDFDARGRLWVAECYSYPQWQETGIDRILIFEDSDADGHFDRRKVFLDKLPNLTGLTVGHGGVWVLSAPRLLFYPDRNRDDVPDGEPTVILDGWTLKAGHNIVNGLTWGPDGWLYGCHGITAESLVGRPGTPADKRTRLRCSIWRYHPTRKTFEVVTHGTTNPWGVDFDDHGEAFFTNCVIGHLWHVIPGAHYQRMYGQDYNPHAYELIAATSDHLHWGGGDWTSSRGGKGIHSEAGGGHAHVGAMVYLGDNWPREYRNNIFMCNVHGNRLNRDLLFRHRASYVGKHAPDLVTSRNPWFRGVDLGYGPGGAVYVTDWCDLGECHDHDGVHRTSGRIYRISFGPIKPWKGLDLARMSNAELVALQLHANDWYVRQARLQLAERAAAGQPMQEVHRRLHEMFQNQPAIPQKLRALWCLYVTGGAETTWLRSLLAHDNEHIRSWAVRLLVEERNPSPELLGRFRDLAEHDPSGLVRLYLASALQRMPTRDRLPIARALAGHAEDAGDRCLPLMAWYGIEPAVVENPRGYLELALEAQLPRIRRFIARRLAQENAHLAAVVQALARADRVPVQQDLLEGLRTGLRGRKHVKMPAGWRVAHTALLKSSSQEVRLAAQLLALVFDDPVALKTLREWVDNKKVPVSRRETALRALVDKGVGDLLPVLLALLDEPALRRPALQCLAAYDNGTIPREILARYSSFSTAEKEDAIATLVSRPNYALALLDAIAAKKVPRSEVSVFAARQMQNLKNDRVRDRLDAVWGQVRQSSKEKKAAIERYKKRLEGETLARADRSAGRVVFQQTCAQCHRLFGEGGQIGPDLTGSNRNDVHYVLENIIDPGATVSGDYRLTNFFTRKGRLISGIIIEQSDRAITVQTATEKLVLPRTDILESEKSRLSMMPEGLVDKLAFTQLRDLVAYLSAKEQVPLPQGGEGK
jgi:putative membrane-bound dehydrogenase-like protein